jgi:hypothetical protein
VNSLFSEKTLSFIWYVFSTKVVERAWSANFKMVWYVLLRPLIPELDGQDPFQISEPCVQLEKRRLKQISNGFSQK